MFSSSFFITLPNIGIHFSGIHFPEIHFPRNSLSKRKPISSKQTGLNVNSPPFLHFLEEDSGCGTRDLSAYIYVLCLHVHAYKRGCRELNSLVSEKYSLVGVIFFTDGKLHLDPPTVIHVPVRSSANQKLEFDPSIHDSWYLVNLRYSVVFFIQNRYAVRITIELEIGCCPPF